LNFRPADTSMPSFLRSKTFPPRREAAGALGRSASFVPQSSSAPFAEQRSQRPAGAAKAVELSRVVVRKGGVARVLRARRVRACSDPGALWQRRQQRRAAARRGCSPFLKWAGPRASWQAWREARAAAPGLGRWGSAAPLARLPRLASWEAKALRELHESARRNFIDAEVEKTLTARPDLLAEAAGDPWWAADEKNRARVYGEGYADLSADDREWLEGCVEFGLVSAAAALAAEAAGAKK